MDDELLKIGDDTISLADLAGLDMSGIEAFEFQITPKGKFHLCIQKAELGTIGDGEKKKANVKFECEIKNCALVDSSESAENWTGKLHQENFVFANDPVKTLGSVKAFVQNIGVVSSGTLQEVLKATEGHEFVAQIKHRKDPNDEDKVYSNINRDKKKLGAFTGTF